MVILALLRMDTEVLLGTHRGTQSLTPATRDTASLVAVPELVSLTDYGQDVYQHAQVSALPLYVLIGKHMSTSKISSITIYLYAYLSVMHIMCIIALQHMTFLLLPQLLHAVCPLYQAMDNTIMWGRTTMTGSSSAAALDTI